ncbi:MAG: hypothetical protein E5V91_02245 [Mesorhizobium sp.]|uniref:hypothetical protein n=1 Tax=Mesorhizobium sp. M2A.F.Ca.ET.067.02.1.1 TaxID=2496749 RepID=UPI000FD211C9|nr:hypothetical protein [Mesorhizobium sp. M2A.F.Ca.ET.067.02.1.1]RUW80462.1 hypothetical protein EOA28_04835 [Mesorhizobium sp. M2A.F.Ca.ET.067.02.1.1]TIU58181.1 MAG: hypothetical protein E5W35_05575 [Mesorhizobium sp.]TIV41614.1 MAG: hypothetical protein E5V91_02245 [Mesorhizobium sp.]TIW86039.1 MAG: hypothetical protein E5V52_07020 [Mesorhizobium sp.]
MQDENGFDPRWNGKSIPKKHWHFHQQLFARYNITLGPGEFSQMLRDIKTGRATIIERRSSSKIVYMIRNTRLWERYFVLVTNGHVVTALPPSRRFKRLWRGLPD